MLKSKVMMTLAAKVVMILALKVTKMSQVKKTKTSAIIMPLDGFLLVFVYVTLLEIFYAMTNNSRVRSNLF